VLPNEGTTHFKRGTLTFAFRSTSSSTPFVSLHPWIVIAIRYLRLTQHRLASFHITFLHLSQLVSHSSHQKRPGINRRSAATLPSTDSHCHTLQLLPIFWTRRNTFITGAILPRAIIYLRPFDNWLNILQKSVHAQRLPINSPHPFERGTWNAHAWFSERY
jgi:hypothetical protein